MSFLWILSRDLESSNIQAVIILKYSVYYSSKAGLHEVKAWLEILGWLEHIVTITLTNYSELDYMDRLMIIHFMLIMSVHGDGCQSSIGSVTPHVPLNH